MAEKRMFAVKIIDSDAFLEMPLSTQALYFHLNMRADDDGFVNNPKKITKYIGASDDDLRLLLMKRFIIGFDSGVIVIKHWRMHNTLRSDRYKPTDYQEELARLTIKDNRSYTDNPASDPDYLPAVATARQPSGNQAETIWQPSGNPDKNRLDIDKVSKEESIEIGGAGGRPAPCDASVPEAPPPPPDVKHKHGEYGWVRLTDKEYKKLLEDLGQAELDRCIAYIDESAQSNGNKNKWKDWNLVIRKCSKLQWGVRPGDRKPFKYDYGNSEGSL